MDIWLILSFLLFLGVASSYFYADFSHEFFYSFIKNETYSLSMVIVLLSLPSLDWSKYTTAMCSFMVTL